MTAENFCSACPEGCAKCSLLSGKVICSSCKDTYGLSGTTCIKCEFEGCKECYAANSNGSYVCTSCLDNYFINNDECKACPDNCEECKYDKKYICTKCKKGFALSSDGRCIVCPLACKSCSVQSDSTTKCSECESAAYSLKPDGTCESCRLAVNFYCTLCGPSAEKRSANCTQCSTGYVVNNDLSCSSCNVEGCILCARENQCEECNKGTFLTNLKRNCTSINFIIHCIINPYSILLK